MDVKTRKRSQSSNQSTVLSFWYPAVYTRMLPQRHHFWGKVIWDFLCFEKGFTPPISWTPTSASPLPSHYPRCVVPSATLSWADILRRFQTLKFLEKKKEKFLFCSFEEERPRKFYQNKSRTENRQSTNFTCVHLFCIMLWKRKLKIILDNIPMNKWVEEEYFESVLSLIREEDVASLWDPPLWVIELLGRYCPPPWQQNTMSWRKLKCGWGVHIL